MDGIVRNVIVVAVVMVMVIMVVSTVSVVVVIAIVVPAVIVTVVNSIVVVIVVVRVIWVVPVISSPIIVLVGALGSHMVMGATDITRTVVSSMILAVIRSGSTISVSSAPSGGLTTSALHK